MTSRTRPKLATAHGLGDFEAQRRGGYSGTAQGVLQESEEFVIVETGAGKIDCVVRGGAPAHVSVPLVARVVEQQMLDDPAVNRRHQAVAFGRGEKVARRDDRALLIDQTQQHFELPAAGAVLEVENTLLPDLEAVFLQRFLQTGHPFHFLALALAGGAAEVELRAVAAQVLGDVAGRVGRTHYFLGGNRFVVDRAHANTRGYLEIPVVPGKTMAGDGFAQRFGQLHCCVD